MEAALARTEEEGRQIRQAIPPKERLSCTAGYPGSPSVDVWYSLLVYLYTAGVRVRVREVMSQAREWADEWSGQRKGFAQIAADKGADRRRF